MILLLRPDSYQHSTLALKASPKFGLIRFSYTKLSKACWSHSSCRRPPNCEEWGQTRNKAKLNLMKTFPPGDGCHGRVRFASWSLSGCLRQQHGFAENNFEKFFISLALARGVAPAALNGFAVSRWCRTWCRLSFTASAYDSLAFCMRHRSLCLTSRPPSSPPTSPTVPSTL